VTTTEQNKANLARAIASVATLHGEFTLRSGAVASEYFDKYRFESDPLLLRAVAEHLALLIPPEMQALAGQRCPLRHRPRGGWCRSPRRGRAHAA